MATPSTSIVKYSAALSSIPSSLLEGLRKGVAESNTVTHVLTYSIGGALLGAALFPTLSEQTFVSAVANAPLPPRIKLNIIFTEMGEAMADGLSSLTGQKPVPHQTKAAAGVLVGTTVGLATAGIVTFTRGFAKGWTESGRGHTAGVLIGFGIGYGVWSIINRIIQGSPEQLMMGAAGIVA